MPNEISRFKTSKISEFFPHSIRKYWHSLSDAARIINTVKRQLHEVTEEKTHESLLNVKVQILNQEFHTIQISEAQNVSLLAFLVLVFFCRNTYQGTVVETKYGATVSLVLTRCIHTLTEVPPHCT